MIYCILYAIGIKLAGNFVFGRTCTALLQYGNEFNDIYYLIIKLIQFSLRSFPMSSFGSGFCVFISTIQSLAD